MNLYLDSQLIPLTYPMPALFRFLFKDLKNCIMKISKYSWLCNATYLFLKVIVLCKTIKQKP